ncbi:MAG: alpha-ketoglutarate-dependent dioxygenase AlkB [Bacteroidota bacterium]
MQPLQLPLNCQVSYFPEFMETAECRRLFDLLIEKHRLTEKRMHQMGDGSVIELDIYQKLFVDLDIHTAKKLPAVWGETIPWPPLLRSLKDKVEDTLRDTFNVCMAIYYPDGNAHMDFHSDLPAYGDTSSIASISLGAERHFAFRPKAQQEATYSLLLKNGSLVHMGLYCQERYEHALPPTPDCREPRINLTFRKYGS